MPRIDDLWRNDVARGVAIGVGVAAAAAFLLPAVRPVARAVVKTGLVGFERSRELVAEAGEAFEELVAEVKADIAANRLGVATAAQAAQTPAETAKPND